MEEDYKLFSIIVPTFQIEHYIGQCILSLVNQCGEESEIIIVDDGSYDKSGQIADDCKNVKSPWEGKKNT